MQVSLTKVVSAVIGAGLLVAKPASGSVLKDLLSTVTTEALIEECELRGLSVEASDD